MLKIHRIDFQNRWPYEKTDRVRVVDDMARITLETEPDELRMWRVHDGGGHVSWSLIEDFHGLLGPGVRRAGEIWAQIDYSLYSSRSADDDARIAVLRERLLEDGMDAVEFHGELRPDSLHVGSMEDAFHTLRLEGDVRADAFHGLYISQPSDIPPINDHTIPEGERFGWVDLQITTYGPLDEWPTYRELINRLKAYSRCFDGLIG